MSVCADVEGFESSGITIGMAAGGRTEFQIGDAGEFEKATRTPLRKAAKPSSYFIFKVSFEIAEALATSKRTRR